MSPLRTRLAGGLLALVTAVLVAGCTVPPPEGAAPLRYRDLIFNDVSVTKDVVYTQAPAVGGGTQPLTMDVYQPAGDTETARPVIIWAHGGYFAAGSSTNTDVATLARNFAQRGYVAVSINYRLLAAGLGCNGDKWTGGCIDAAFAAADDLQAAVDYVAAHTTELRVNRGEIAVGGTSAGAIAAVLVSATGATGGKDVSAAVSISGGVPPIVKVGDGVAPVLFWHGTADTVVPYSWAVSNVQAMNQGQQIAILRNVKGAGHVPFAQYGTDMDEQSRNFLYRALGL